ncbi:MAG TPA: dihydrofolate reductase [Sphingobium sp.]
MADDKPEIVLLFARADNGVIGANGDIPWNIPADLRRFKAMTMGTPMLMGRKTFESLPGILADRRHIVLTRDTNWSAPGAEAVHSMDEAIAAAHAPVLSVIGGADLHRMFEPIADRLEYTEVHASPPGDTTIPAPDPARWQATFREDFPALGDVPAYSYVTYRRT